MKESSLSHNAAMMILKVVSSSIVLLSVACMLLDRGETETIGRTKQSDSISSQEVISIVKTFV